MTLVLPDDAPYPRYAPNRSSTGQIWAIEVTMLNEATIAAFRASLRGGLIEPGDPNYEVARKVYNGMIDRRPRLIAHCADVADVMTAAL
jgi:hypothetical protein